MRVSAPTRAQPWSSAVDRVPELAQSLELEPDMSEVHLEVNRERLFGRWSRAHLPATWARALEAETRQSAAAEDVWRLRADLAFCRGRSRTAERCYRALAENGRAIPSDRRRSGLARFARGALEESAAVLRTAVALCPDDWMAWRHLGCVHMAENLQALAEHCYRIATRIAPDQSEGWRNFGRCRWARGAADAESAYQRAIALAPRSAEAYRNLGHVRYYAQEEEAAGRHYLHAHRIDPNHPLIAFSLGCARLATGAAGEAERLFEQSLRTEPTRYPVFRLALCHALEAQGKPPGESFVNFRRQAVEGFALVQRKRFGLSPDPASARYMRPVPFAAFFDDRGLEVEELPFDPPPPPPAPGEPGHVRESVARAERTPDRLRFVRRASIDVSIADFCSSASIIGSESYIAERVFERPAAGPHSHPIYFPPNDPLGFPNWVRDMTVPAVTLEEPGIFIGGSFNYGHFLLDTLGKLLAAERFGAEGGRCVYTFPLHNDFGTIARSLFPDRRFVDLTAVGARNGIFRFADVQVPANAPYHMIVRALRERAELACPPAAGGGSEKVYLSRRNYFPHRHRVDNEEEVAAFLESRGFSIVFPEKLDFFDTVRCFRNARFIVAPIGAQYGNVVFCRPGAVYIEMAPQFHRSNPSNQTYDCISHYADVRFHRIWGEDTFIDRHDPTLWYSRFDVGAIADALDSSNSAVPRSMAPAF